MHIPHTVHSHIKPDPKITTKKKEKKPLSQVAARFDRDM